MHSWSACDETSYYYYYYYTIRLLIIVLNYIYIYICGRNESFPNQVLFALRMGRRADATLTNLFNPTSGKDVAHLCLISTWPKEGCTIVRVMWASLKSYAHTHNALLWLGPALWIRRGKVGGFPWNPKRHLFVGGNLVLNPNHVLSSSELAARGASLILKVLLNPTSGRDASHPYFISTWPKEWCTIVCVMWVSLKNCIRMHYALLRLGSTL